MSTLLVAVAMLMCACGVQTQSRPEQITIAYPSSTGPDAPRAKDGPSVTVFFVRGAHLQAARRSVSAPDLATALQALAGGPTRQEVLSGVRTALAPQEFGVSPSIPVGPTVVIDVPREFTGVAGGNQLLAVAQLVWTVTEAPEVRQVRLTSEGRPLEVPTDEGLSDRAVSRDDYRSVAPPDFAPVTSEPPVPSDPPTPPPPPTETAPASGSTGS